MDLKEMIELYNSGLSTGKIAKLAGYKTAKSVADKLKKAQVPLRTSAETKIIEKGYSDNMFAILDADWKAYYLGLLLTDGWVTHRIDGKIDIIGWSSVDKDVAGYISTCTGKSIQTVHRKGMKEGPKGKPINQSTEYRIVLNSEQIAKDLARFGVIENKTHVIPAPQLTSEELSYLRLILRGIIDGDGTLGFPSNSHSMYFRIISMSEAFIDWCIWALELLGMKNLHKNCQDESGLWRVESALVDNLLILAFTIYKEPLGLKRKRNKIFNHIFEYTIGRAAKKFADENS